MHPVTRCVEESHTQKWMLIVRYLIPHISTVNIERNDDFIIKYLLLWKIFYLTMSSNTDLEFNFINVHYGLTMPQSVPSWNVPNLKPNQDF